MNKIICIDAGAITFNAIHAYGSQIKAKMDGRVPQNMFIPPAHYTYFNMILSALKRIGVEETDSVFICVDGRNSWRKAFLKTYKGQRKDQRASYTHIDWHKEFNNIKNINDQIEASTGWYVLQFDKIFNLLDILQTKEGECLIENPSEDMFEYDYGLEADDIQAVIAKNYQDKEVVVVTCDKDIYQLAYFPQTKIYTLNIKVKGQKGGYVFVEKPLKIIADKIRKGDKSDNILVTKFDTAKDEEIREFIIDLLNLPDWVTNPILNKINDLEVKKTDSNFLPFPNSLGKKFFDIYKKDKILDYNYCIELQKKREKRRKEKANIRAKERYQKIKKEKING